VHFKLTFKESKTDGLTIYTSERKDDGMMASVLEEMEKRKKLADTTQM
jgi:hypothetical protein